MRSLSLLTGALALVCGWANGEPQGLVIQSGPKAGIAAQQQLDHNQLPTHNHNIDASQNDQLLADNLVSALSASTQHTTLLRLLQRSKSIPLLAHIGNATLFAPTDEAWKSWEEAHRPSTSGELFGGWLSSHGLEEWYSTEEEVLRVRTGEGGDGDGEKRKLDNQNWWLRQHLLYHMLNYTLPPSSLNDTYLTPNFDASKNKKGNGGGKRGEDEGDVKNRVSMETTLLFPMVEEPPLPPTPPPGPPWLPRGGEGLLGGHGQRLRILRGTKDERGTIGVDWTGEGGASIWDGSGWPNEEDDGNNGPGRDDRIIYPMEGTGIWPGSKKGKKGDEEDDPASKNETYVQGARWVRNGVVVGIDKVLDAPPSIQEIIDSDPSLKYLSRLLSESASCPAPLPEDLGTAPHLTIFAPSDQAFDGAFDDIERAYLEGGYGGEGVGRIVGGGVVLSAGRDRVGWSDEWGKHDTVTSASGQNLSIEISDTVNLAVNGQNATTIDILASNGVIHIVPQLILPENFTLLNSAEKVLLSVNATRFVSLLRDANLSNTYIGEPGKEQDQTQAWTFLAPTDEVMDMMDRWGGQAGLPIPHIWRQASLAALNQKHGDQNNDLEVSLGPQTGEPPFKDASPLAALLQYHILPGRLTTSDIKDGMLVSTELRTSALEGGRQRLGVEVSDSLDRKNWENIGQGELRFGGASVLGKPVRSGKSIIYLISSLLAPPDDVLQTAVSNLQLSTFIAAVYAADLDQAVKHTPGVTWFLPRNRACNALGLGMQYLLLPEGKDELRKVLKYHAVDGVIYSSDIEIGKSVRKTLEGGDIILGKSDEKNSSLLTLSSPTKWQSHDSGESFPSNGELRPAKVSRTDALTSTGVIHTIDSLEMPADVSLTIAKLIRGSRQNTMLDLMSRAGLDWVLQGREPTHQEVSRAQLNGAVKTWAEQYGDDEKDGHNQENRGPDMNSLAMPSYTVLCPSDKAFSRLNLTLYMSDRDALLDLLKLHIIPTQPSTPRTGKTKQPASPPRDGQPLSLGDDLVYQSLLSPKSKYGDLAFRATGDNSYIVGIRNARGREGLDMNAARVGASGRATVRWRRNQPSSLSSTTQYHKLKRWFSTSQEDEDDDDGSTGISTNVDLWTGGMALGGGVLMIDNVLIPYEPSWWSKWGWLVTTLIAAGVIILIAAALIGGWWMSKGKKEKYEPLEGEEEE